MVEIVENKMLIEDRKNNPLWGDQLAVFLEADENARGNPGDRLAGVKTVIGHVPHFADWVKIISEGRDGIGMATVYVADEGSRAAALLMKICKVAVNPDRRFRDFINYCAIGATFQQRRDSYRRFLENELRSGKRIASLGAGIAGAEIDALVGYGGRTGCITIVDNNAEALDMASVLARNLRVAVKPLCLDIMSSDFEIYGYDTVASIGCYGNYLPFGVLAGKLERLHEKVNCVAFDLLYPDTELIRFLGSSIGWPVAKSEEERGLHATELDSIVSLAAGKGWRLKVEDYEFGAFCVLSR